MGFTANGLLTMSLSGQPQEVGYQAAKVLLQPLVDDLARTVGHARTPEVMAGMLQGVAESFAAVLTLAEMVGPAEYLVKGLQQTLAAVPTVPGVGTLQ